MVKGPGYNREALESSNTMSGINSGIRPKGFKTVALLGVFANTLALAVMYPVALYFEYTQPEQIPILRIISWLSWIVYLPLTGILLVGSIGLLCKQNWSRSLCLWALTVDLIFGICEVAIDTSIRIANWSSDTIYDLAIIPILLLFYIAEGAVLFYLNNKSIKLYLEKCSGNTHGQ